MIRNVEKSTFHTQKNPKNPKLVWNPILGLGFFGFFGVEPPPLARRPGT